jgi:hypothetical protein
MRSPRLFLSRSLVCLDGCLVRDGRMNGSTAYSLFAWQDASPNRRDIGQQAIPLIPLG